MIRNASLTALALVLCTAALHAQAAPGISGLVPTAAAEGDILQIKGSGLAATTSVAFTANVGGFVGAWTETATPISVTDTCVEVIVPTIAAGWVPPGVPGGSSTIGTVTLQGTAGRGLNAPFFFIQAFPTVDTTGLGTTQAGGLGRAVCAFPLSAGPPVPGNSAFELSLENAIPNSVAILGIGAPAMTPIPYLDGSIAVDLLAPYQLTPPIAVGASGSIVIPAPMPSLPIGVVFSVQWIVIDSFTSQTHVSNALQVDI